METGLSQEEYVRQVLEAYRKTPGTMGRFAVPTGRWQPNFINAVFR
ncbi:MAG TPA: hypothetical protein VKX49_03770 [Bryobacteraceae bacterium]|nr:hypothetical protein [Bryobacteraceae bacterium]